MQSTAELWRPEREVAPFAGDFLLDPDVVYLNHAAYGAAPAPVFDSYQRWQRLLERDPVDFLSRRGEERLEEARAALAAFVGCDRDDLVYVTNATIGLNTIARSLRFGPGDEVLGTAHEHGGIERMWRHWGARAGFAYRTQDTTVPLTTHAAFLDEFWAGVSERTRVICVSQITSPTGVVLPVREICARARAAGIVTVVDGSHAPGQIPVDLTDLGADFYVALTHKWLNAPKGSGFLYARRELQPSLEPLAASWGVAPMNPHPSPFIDYHQWQGSRDISAFLAVPDAVAYVEQPGFEAERRRCRALARETHAELTDLTGLPPFNPATDEWNAQFFAVPLPPHVDAKATALELYERDRIEVSVFPWQDRPKLRVSIQVYNTRSDVDALLAALTRVLR
jgi:isopenicillin-N epimerase